MKGDKVSTHLAIRLDSHKPMRGVVQSGGTESQPFVGWLGLLKVLEGHLSPNAAAEEGGTAIKRPPRESSQGAPPYRGLAGGSTIKETKRPRGE